MEHKSFSFPTIIDNDEFFNATQRLSANVQKKHFYTAEYNKLHKGVTISESYRTRNLRQRFYYDCKFNYADFHQSSLAGSLFNQCSFTKIDFFDTNLQSCDFRTCRFSNITFKSTRFNKSTFSDVKFENCIFETVSFNDAIFDECQFINCEWVPIVVENVIFRRTLLDTVKIRKMNFEYSTFDNVKLNNIKLPFQTIPYIYNGLTYLSSTQDNVCVTSALNPAGISIEEYLLNIPDMITYYHNICEYFPLTNIYIMQKNYEAALQSVYCGLGLAIELRRFRMIKYFCKELDFIPSITLKDRQSLYTYILNQLSKQDFASFETDSLNMYLPEVKRLLIDDYSNNKIQVMFETNIPKENFPLVRSLISSLDEALKDKCSYSIEMRHNSPWSFLLNIITNPNAISEILSIISIVLGLAQLHTNSKKGIDLSTKLNNNYVNVNKQKRNQKIVFKNVTIINQGTIYIGEPSSKQD